jgi:F1F0 ATPase subunit 2
MSHDPPPWALLVSLTLALAGFAVGLLYFAALYRTVTLLTARRGWQVPAALALARFAGAASAFALAARLGAPPLLAAFIGFLAARVVVLRVVRRAA